MNRDFRHLSLYPERYSSSTGDSGFRTSSHRDGRTAIMHFDSVDMTRAYLENDWPGTDAYFRSDPERWQVHADDISSDELKGNVLNAKATSAATQPTVSTIGQGHREAPWSTEGWPRIWIWIPAQACLQTRLAGISRTAHGGCDVFPSTTISLDDNDAKIAAREAHDAKCARAAKGGGLLKRPRTGGMTPRPLDVSLHQACDRSARPRR